MMLAPDFQIARDIHAFAVGPRLRVEIGNQFARARFVTTEPSAAAKNDSRE